MKYVKTFIFLASFFLLNCFNNNLIEKTDLYIKYSVKLKNRGTHFEFDTVSIINSGDKFLYIFGDMHTNLYMSLTDDGNYEDYIKYKYFVLKEDDTTGCYYDTLGTNKYRRLGVDSVLQARNIKLEKIFNHKNNSSTLFYRSKDKMIERYLVHRNRSSKYKYIDTIALYYNGEIRTKTLYISQKFEERIGRRIGKAEYIFGDTLRTESSGSFSKVSFELREQTVELPKELENLINHHPK